MKYTSQHFCDKTMDVGGSDGLNRPPGFAPVLTPLRTPMTLTYQEFKTVCLSSV